MADHASTPLMRQYYEIKARYSDSIVFFRLGDFYEMFDADAKWVSAAIGLTLTARQGTPMCGVPHHSAETYIAKLLEKGKKVALCEQVSQPDKGLAQRDVVEIISPGAILSQNLLKSSDSNYICSLSCCKNIYSFSYIDLSTSEFVALATDQPLEGWFYDELDKLRPREIVLNETLLTPEFQQRLTEWNLLINRYPDWLFNIESSYKKLCDQFAAFNLKAFGFNEKEPALIAAGTLLHYVLETTKHEIPHVRNLEKRELFSGLLIDEQSRLNLEIVMNSNDRGSDFTLWHALNRTTNPMGSRLLKRWLLNPLVDEKQINERLDRVELLLNDQSLLQSLRHHLKNIQDIERLNSRLAMDKAHAKDLRALAVSLSEALMVRALLKEHFLFGDEQSDEVRRVVEQINTTLTDDPSIVLNESNLIRRGFNEELDRYHLLSEDSKTLMENYAAEERELTGLNLRLKENRVVGYFFEINKAHADKLPNRFIRRQSMTSGERYSTEQLAALQHDIAHARDKAVDLEKELFLALRAELKDKLVLFLDLAAQIGLWDVSSGLAKVASEYNYCRPVVRDSQTISITGGRHPVVEQAVAHNSFVPNNLNISRDQRFMLITGPNMAGKSTYLRQNALIVFMAQIGSFVSASQAEIGIADRIFCRVGASDNLAKGESTFLVEMNETARILRHASPRSLVIMDEIGRGTGSDDGLAIAWAVLEHLADVSHAATLFATHYHELTRLQNKHVSNYRLRVKEEGGHIYFLKQVEEGAATGSYGIHVARLAGIPAAVADRAEHYLAYLVKSKDTQDLNKVEKPIKKPVVQELFSGEELLKESILSFDVNKSTPVEALLFLEKLKKSLS